MERILSKEIVAKIKVDLAELSTELPQDIRSNSYLAAVICSDDTAAESYLGAKLKFASSVGVSLKVFNYSDVDDEADLISKIKDIDTDPECKAVIIELPLKKGMDELKVSNALSPEKDVDGLGVISTGAYVQKGLDVGAGFFIPATPQACLILAETVTDLSGKSVAVLGRGRTVGKPLANLLISKGATVTVCHSRTKDIQDITRRSDVVFTAMGRPKSLNADYFTDGTVIVDAGIGFTDTGISGDVDLDSISDLAVNVTPVPGGVGPLTTALLFSAFLNCLKDLSRKEMSST